MGKKLLFLNLLLFAFLLPTTVLAQCPTGITISSDVGTSICEGSTIVFTASPNGGTNVSYEWFVNTTSSGSNSSFSTNALSNNDKVKVVATSSDEPACSTTSNILTITVNTNRTPTVSINASKTTICPGENVTFTAVPTNGGSSPSYIWKIGSAVQSGNSNTFSTTSLTNGQPVTVELTSNATCASPTSATSSPINVTVKADAPATPGAITGEAVVCPGISSLTYSIASVANATSYEWSLPNGWTGNSTSNSINVTSGNTGNGTITVKAKNDCGTSLARSFDVEVMDATPNTPGTITGDAQVCPGLTKTYSIAAVSGATAYEWTLPSGWSGTSTSNSIDVISASSGNGTISVKAKNSCGTSAAKTIAVSVKPGTPATPNAISGTTAICPGTTNTYSITAVANATSYEWLLPNGWTGSSSSTSINATSNSNGGTISVKAVNDCGTSTEQTLAITIKPGIPVAPSAISGSNNVCPNTSETYSVTNNPDASEYIWTLPNGWSGTSTSSSITVNTASSGSGNITVKAKNDCGTSTAASFAVAVKAPAPVMTGIISGPASVCSGGSGLVYTIPAISNATSYTWTLPSGWSGTSTTNSITATAGASGNISVVATNSCGDSSSSANFAVSATSGVPATPINLKSNLLASNPNLCPPVTGITFTVDAVSNATSYNWIMPTGWEITSGINTNSIIAKINANAPSPANQTVKVEAVNICGKSGQVSYTEITVADHITVDLGQDKTLCKSLSSIPLTGYVNFGNANFKPTFKATGRNNDVGFTAPSTVKDNFDYSYLPVQADLDRGQVTITLTVPKPNGNSSACGSSTDEMVIFFKPDPIASISGTSTICTGNATDIVFSGTSNTIVTYTKNGGTNQTIAIGDGGTATLNTGALTANTTYSLVSVKNASTPDCPKTVTGSAVVSITPKPTATISYNASPFSKCLTSGTVTLTGTGAYELGVYTAPAGLSINASTGAINPSGSTAGTYEVKYTTPASGGCTEVVATATVVIIDEPTVTLNYGGTPFCSDGNSSALPTLGGTGNYQGGTYSSTAGLSINANTGAIDIQNSTPETYTVTYSIIPSSGCTAITQTAEVKITEKPQPTIAYNAVEFCKSVSTSQPVNLTGTGLLTGGTYSSTPAGLNLDANGSINPGLSEAGNYTVKYSLDAANGCEAVYAETPVSISEIPSAEISYAGPFCQSDSTLKDVSFSNTIGAYQGGVFSNSSNLSIDANGKITPSSSASGEHTVTYKIPASGGCPEVIVSTQVIITPQPAATITYNGPFCTSESTPQDVTFSDTFGAYTTGVFTGTNGLSIAADGKIIPSESSKGSHTVTYTIPAANGCPDVVSTADIEIFEEVVIANQPSNVGICSTQAASFSVVASGDNLSYQWKRTDGAAITNASGINTAELSFNNATSVNSGEYYVEVTGNAACSAMAVSETVTLNIDENIIIIKPVEDETYCENDITEQTFEYIAHANGAELTFVWIKDGAEIPTNNPTKYTFSKQGPTGVNGEYSGKLTILDLDVADNGKYAVKITGPTSFTCSEATSKTFTLSIKDQPEAPVTSDLTYCQFDVAAALTATGSNLKWYESETGDDLITGTPTPSTDTFGTFTYWVSQTPSECESPRAKLEVIIKEKPNKPTTTEALSFCLNNVVTAPLEAEGDSGNTINWYAAVDSATPLSSAPIPDTSIDVATNYWVSQTKDGCESDRVQVSITINPLPILTVGANDSVICSGTSTTLNATGATTYLWTVDGNAIEPASESTKASPLVSPTTTTTYVVTGTSDKGCTSTAEVTVEVNEQSVGGVITPSTSAVCVSGNSGTLSLAGSGYVGDILRWESSLDNGVSWTTINNTSEILSFSNLAQKTLYRAAIKNGVCDEVFSTTSEITVDPLPVAGELLFNGTDRIFLICENPDAGNVVPLHLTGYTGNIVGVRYRKSTATSWTSISANTSGLPVILNVSQIENLVIDETIIFQVEVSSGVCTPNVFTETAILSVIPSDITPTPVTVDPDVVCLGEEVTLSSSTGYTNRPNFLDQGAFDNASITNHGWRVRRNGNSTDLGFDTDANNTRPDRWKRATRHQFTTADINSPYTIREDLYISSGGVNNTGNKGFAVVSSNNSATLETPVFGIDGLDQAILTFDQMYNLTPGASIKVEISTDGGNSYNTTLYEVITDPNSSTGLKSGFFDGFASGDDKNQIEVDLGNYMGYTNLRIRFNYVGARIGDVWAIDNIDIPDGPQEVVLEWYDYTDPDTPIFIGNSESENWTPTKIGVNVFEVRTAIILDSNGNSCQTIENKESVEVFVFDTYTSTATANGGVCGDLNVVLNGEITSVLQGVITEFPTLDGYTVGTWEVVGPTGYTPSASHFTPSINDPNATFTPNFSGSYTLTWTMTATSKDETGNLIPNTNCPPIYVPVVVSIEDCTTLDFDGFDDFADIGTGYTGNYSIEAWIYPESNNGTIISGPTFEIKMSDLPATVSPNTRWYHVAVSNGKLYVDGIELGNAGTGTGGDYAIIGARWNNTTASTENHFSGWIEEVRIWSTTITQDQIQFMMNQHLQNAGNMGVEIPMPVPGGLAYSDLAGYYRLISKVPDPLNLISFPSTLLPINGLTPDLALNSVPGRLVNMTTNQENTAPLPYLSANDGVWSSLATWLRPNVWDYPNAFGINSSTPIDWNIVRTSHNISSGGKDIVVLGLISDTSGKILRIADPNGAQDETNAGQSLRVTHYLELDGNIDLVGESQLLQDEGSILAESSAGYLERDQQGTLSSFNYNYWTAPVSLQGAPNNSGFTVGGIMWDGTDTDNPKGINYRPDHAAADGAKTNPITKSNYWIFKFANQFADDYDSWQHIGSTGFLKTGEGHTMKGVSGAGGVANINKTQNYVYRGKPNNGNITLTIDKERNYLVGNPYPSAIDVEQFILDNLNSADVAGATNSQNIFDGTVYFWDHFSGATHILREYIGGYATLNLTGGAPAISTDDRILANNASGTKTPKQFIPVSQGFFVNTGTYETLSGGAPFTLDGGPITFKNSQRVFARESSGNSIFLKPEIVSKTNKEEEKSSIPKIRVSFKSPKGYHRQLLVGANPITTNGFDLGYDAPMIEYNVEDMYWLQGGNYLVIQGVPDFGKDQILPLGIRIEKTGEFTIKIDSLENISSTQNVYLRDQLLDSIHDIKEEPYMGSAEPGEYIDRYQLIFFKESAQDPIVVDPIVNEDPIIIDDLSEISLLHSYLENEMMVLNPKELRITAIYLFDLNGKLLDVFDEVPSEKEIRLKLSTYSEGIYALKMHTDEQIITRKIIIKK